ncbi:MAG TPA: CHASE2 domain-containing protein [Leptolyngbyaceae cyanobacterium]
MEKLVTLKLSAGSLETGFSVILQICEKGGWPTVEMDGALPPAPELQHTYRRWQAAYRRLGLPYRLEAKKSGFATNVSRIEDCREVAQVLSKQFNQWLNADSFRPLQDKLLEKLDPRETIRLVVQTQQTAVQRLPWQTWHLCDRYPKAEIALSTPTFERISLQSVERSKVRVLAILGNSQGIDIQTDQALLNHLPNADVKLLIEPDRQTLTTLLWDPEGWDILFFAGHSTSKSASQADPTETIGQLFINPTDSLTIPELKHALRKSLERGLKIAIFNSCDGLGLAQALADLHIAQVLVMREPVPDGVAHEFLKSFLEAFSRGETFYLAVREAREKLHGLEDKFPCATWLPAIFQNPAESPPTWLSLSTPILEPEPVAKPIALPERTDPSPWRRALTAGLIVAAVIVGMRQFGAFQAVEVWAFDHLMHWRPKELSDARLVVVAITESDIQAQDSNRRRGSLSDEALSALLQKLEAMQPRVVGLDIYRDFTVLPDQTKLARQLQAANRLFVVCKVSDAESSGIKPPPEVAKSQVGFSDFVVDADNIVRRHLLALTPKPNSPCQANYSLSTLLALQYLDDEGVPITTTPKGELQVGQVVFEPIEKDFGGYQKIDADGHQILLNYRTLPSPDLIADQVTLGDVLAGRVDPEAIRDRIVLIGTTARSFGDYWETSYRSAEQANGEVAGVFMQAQMTSQILSAVLDNRLLIRTWPNHLEILWILTWVSLGGVLAGWAKVLFPSKGFLTKLILSILVAESVLFSASWLLLVRVGYWVPWVPPALAIPLTAGIASAGVGVTSRRVG